MEEFSLERLDQNITLAINALNSPWSDAVWTAFSNKYVWIPLYLAVVVLIVKQFGWRKALIIIGSCVLTIVACDQLGNLFKYGFERLRPCWDDYMLSHENFHLLVPAKAGSKFGFFSAHAANTMGFAVFITHYLKANKARGYKIVSWVLIVWAFLVGMSRVFVGKHFFGDVMVGFAMGTVVGLVFSLIALKICKSLR